MTHAEQNGRPVTTTTLDAEIRSLLAERARLRQAASKRERVETWRLVHAKAFIDRVEAELAARGTVPDPDLAAALRAGRGPLADMQAQIQRELASMAPARTDLTRAEWQQRCWGLRLRCLQHLDRIFSAERTTP
jgi:hypothetical protein